MKPDCQIVVKIRGENVGRTAEGTVAIFPGLQVFNNIHINTKHCNSLLEKLLESE